MSSTSPSSISSDAKPIPSHDMNAHTKVRSIKFWRPESLGIVNTGSGLMGDDFRADLQTSEQVIYSLLLSHDSSPTYDPHTSTWNGPGMAVDGGEKLRPVAFNSRQPIVCVAWPSPDGKVRPWITDGRQRARTSSDGHKNRGAVEAINHRLGMVVSLAKELQEKEHGLSAIETQVATRNEAKRRASLVASRDAARDAHDESPADDKLREELDRAQREVDKAGAEGWGWATSSTISAYTGGRLGDEKTNVQVHGLVMWRVRQHGGPQALEFVCWVEFEPTDRDPAAPKSLIASVALKSAQVADPPSVEARRLAHLVWDPNGEGGREDRKGLGMPVSAVAKLSSVDRKTVQLKVSLMDLEPEVVEALDAFARGEQGLSLNQVRDGGFWLPGTGSGDVRVPRSREEQLQILDALRGRRGTSGVVVDRSGRAGEGRSSEGRAASSSSDSEVTGREGTSSAERRSAGERLASVGPDSPATAGAPKFVQLLPEIFRSLADRIGSELEGYVAGPDGKMPDGTEKGLELCYTEKMLEAVWEFCAVLGGDEHALDQDAERGAGVNEFRKVLGDGLREVLSARGVILRSGGARADGAPVLPADKREPAEVIVTPRAGGEVGQSMAGTAGIASATAASEPATIPAKTAAESAKPDEASASAAPSPKTGKRKEPLRLTVSDKREKVSRAGRKSTLKPDPASKLAKAAKPAKETTTKKTVSKDSGEKAKSSVNDGKAASAKKAKPAADKSKAENSKAEKSAKKSKDKKAPST